MQDSDNMEDTLTPPLKRRRLQITKAADQPDVMEATSETRNGFIRIAMCQDDGSYLEAVLKTGTVDMLEEVNVAHLAAKAGKVECLKVALAYGRYRPDLDTLKAAIEGGSLSCVKLLVERGQQSWMSLLTEGERLQLNEELLAFAAEQAQVACVAYLASLLQRAGDMVAQAGSGHQMSFGPSPFGDGVRRWVAGVCDHMAYCGKLIALQTLVKAECVGHMDGLTLTAAVQGGSRECVRYLSQQVHLPVTMTAVGVALQSGNLECLKLLLDRPARENGMPNPNKHFTEWELSPMRVAMQRGFADCVAFAEKHGCPRQDLEALPPLDMARGYARFGKCQRPRRQLADCDRREPSKYHLGHNYPVWWHPPMTRPRASTGDTKDHPGCL